MTAFEITRDERTMEFTVATTEQVTSVWGTPFVPTLCTARIFNGKVVSIGLDVLDENGWAIEDLAGPNGAELNVSYGNGELISPARAKLPQVARDAIAAIEKAIS